MPTVPTQEANRAPGFFAELSDTWRHVPDKGLFLALLAVWSALFHFRGNAVFGWVDTSSLFQWMFWVFNTNSEDGHGLLVPFIVLALIWWKQGQLVRLPARRWWPALALILLSLLLHVAGYLVQQTRVSIVAYFLGVYGLIGLVGGPAWMKGTFFPMFLFVFCIPLGTISEPLTFPLRMLVAKLTAGSANHVLGINVIRDGSQIMDPSGKFGYDVVAACSGIKSLSILALTATTYAFVYFASYWRRAIMMVAAIPLAIANNVARVLGIIVAEEAFGSAAARFAHEYLWLATFVGALIGVMTIGYLIREPASVRPETPRGGPTEESKPAGSRSFARNQSWAVVTVLLLVGFAALGLSRAKSSFHRLGAPGLRMVDEPVFDAASNIVNTTTVALPREILGLTSKPLPVTLEELGWLPKDTVYGRRRYASEEGFWMDLSVVLMGTDRTSIHKPQVCLTGQGWTIDAWELVNLPVARPHSYELPLMKLTATKRVPRGDGQQAAWRAIFVYWFVCDGRLTAKHSERMWWMAKDLLTTGVLDRWAYVSYYAICQPGEEEATFRRMREAIAASVPEFQLTTRSPLRLQSGFPPGNGG